ncbi:MAG TPA: hypothetical protein VFC24_05805 [Casimicrobiaceae bacterium]|nr:hypothetical protein [Casimicrobiaceae bacterium]
MAHEKPVGGEALWNAIDTLIAVKIELHCHPDVAPEAMILSARRVRSACATIDAAIALLRSLAPPLHIPGGDGTPDAPQDDA